MAASPSFLEIFSSAGRAGVERVEGALAVKALLERLPGLALATGGHAVVDAGVVVHGLTALPVKLASAGPRTPG